MSHKIWYISVISKCGFQEIIAINDIIITQIISGCGEGQTISESLSKSIKSPVISTVITDDILTEHFGDAMMYEMREQDTFEGFDPEAILQLAKSNLTHKETRGSSQIEDPWLVSYNSCPGDDPCDAMSTQELLDTIRSRPDTAYAIALGYDDLGSILETQGYELSHPNFNKLLTLIKEYYGTEEGIIRSMLNLAIDNIDDLGLREESSSIERTTYTYA
ncbi:MAG TPA: hypothetical protein V6D29_11215 [Leptolyngbyaceae cyanobacterium]